MTTTLCHRHTPTTQLHRCLGSADVVVTAAGVPGLVHANIVKPGAVVIDVGLSRVGTKVVGDASQNVREVKHAISVVVELLLLLLDLYFVSRGLEYCFN